MQFLLHLLDVCLPFDHIFDKSSVTFTKLSTTNKKLNMQSETVKFRLVAHNIF